MKEKPTILAMVLIAFAIISIAQGEVIYVDADANGTNDGSSWVDAFNYLQDALNAARYGDEIRVAQGVYTPAGPLLPVPPRQASNPNPADGATEVIITADLSWTAGYGATWHDVYFGTSSPPPFVSRRLITLFNAGYLDLCTTYYWRIDEIYWWGKSTGVVWSFTTGPPPPIPPPPLPQHSNSSGHDQAAEISLDNREITFQLINGVTIKGGYAGFGGPNPNTRNIQLYETILSGDLAGNDIEVEDPHDLTHDPCRADNSYHVVVAIGNDATAVLDGLTITAGNAYGSFDYNNPRKLGGGMYNSTGSPKLNKCTFRSNSAGIGGGMYNEYGNPKLINCTFIENGAYSKAGGMFNSDFSCPTIINCTFSENAGYYGGGMFNEKSSNSIVINCKFSCNSAGDSGGGMTNNKSRPTVTNCTFTGNSAPYGGGLNNNNDAWPIIKNCTFSGNSAFTSLGDAPGGGGGIYNYLNSNVTASNCILWNNSHSGHTDELAQIESRDCKPVVNYSCVQGWIGTYGGTGNIGDAPFFVAPGYWDANGLWVEGDYHLLAGSPCIDSGDPNYVAGPNETDLDGRPRIIGGRIDMGAYEYSPPIQADVDIEPDTLNMTSKGKWITAFIQMPEDYDMYDIDANSVYLEGEIKPEQFWLAEDNQIAIARFSREEVQAILTVGEVELTITGQLKDGISFEGMDVIRVIDEGRRKN